jgi:hypothetical protein
MPAARPRASGPDATVVSTAVVPINDLVEHDDFSEDCVCGPKLVLVENGHGDEWLIVHAALDGRT